MWRNNFVPHNRVTAVDSTAEICPNVGFHCHVVRMSWNHGGCISNNQKVNYLSMVNHQLRIQTIPCTSTSVDSNNAAAKICTQLTASIVSQGSAVRKPHDRPEMQKAATRPSCSMNFYPPSHRLEFLYFDSPLILSRPGTCGAEKECLVRIDALPVN